MPNTKDPQSNLLLTFQELRGRDGNKSIIIAHCDKFYKREMLWGQGHGGRASKSKGGTQDHWDSFRILKKKCIKDFLSQGVSQMTRFVFEVDDSNSNVEAGGDESRQEISIPYAWETTVLFKDKVMRDWMKAAAAGMSRRDAKDITREWFGVKEC